jgi:hypothetical protein
MAKKWLDILSTKAADWSVPAPDVTALGGLTSTAETALAEALSSQRTQIITAQCKMAFDALVEKMRDTKRRWFIAPPLTVADFTALSLAYPDHHRSEIPQPKNQAGLEIVKWAPHELVFRWFTATILNENEIEYGVRVFYGLADARAAVDTSSKLTAERLANNVYVLSRPPTSPQDLPNSFFTRRKKDILSLPPEASGLTCYLAAHFENDKGDQGPFGTMISTLVL